MIIIIQCLFKYDFISINFFSFSSYLSHVIKFCFEIVTPLETYKKLYFLLI